MDYSECIACHDCDLLHSRRTLDGGETASCRRCGAKLFAQKKDMVDRALALNLCSLVLYLIVLSMPFLAINANGIEVRISLFDSVRSLFDLNMELLSVLVFMVLLGAPLARIVGHIFVLLSIKLERVNALHRKIYRTVNFLSPWNMPEVFLIGILVTFVKLGKEATIMPGIAFWVFVILVVAMTASQVSMDRDSVWQKLG